MSSSKAFKASAVATGTALTLGTGAGALGAALLATPAGATNYTVNTNADGGNGSLRQAIIDANANPGIDTITFAGNVTGTIQLVIDLPTITEGLVITGPGATNLELNGIGLYHAFTIETNGTGGVTISGLAITGSPGRFVPSGEVAGGGMIVIDTPLTLTDVIFDENEANSGGTDTAGGGLFVANAAGTGDVTITDSVFYGNSATTSSPNDWSNGGGAAISADDVSISNTLVDLNEGGSGGGIYVFAAGSVSLSSSTITGNIASTIGGVGIGGGNISVVDTVIENNSASIATGGAYLAASSQGANTATLTVSNTSISNNSANELGGALICNFDPGRAAILDRATVSGNTGQLLGGLLLIGDSAITSSTIANNIGAGINVGYGYLPTSIAASPSTQLQPAVPLPRVVSARLSNTTVTGNSREGITANTEWAVGSIQSNAIPSVQPTPPPVELGLVHVLAADNGLEDVAVPAISLFSLIERPNAGVLAGYGTQTGIDPQLQPLMAVSDTVSVVPILPGSPAWDGGYPGFTPPPFTDQRGLPRVVQIVDIGAYEVQEYFVRPKFTG